MAITVPCRSTQTVSLDEYIEFVSRKVNLSKEDDIAASAPMLRALANDRTLIVDRLNRLVANAFDRESVPSAQAIFLGQGDNFYVRANIWPSSADVAGGRLYQERFAYNEAHDHNFSFLTVNHMGPGYETDIFEYDNEKVAGYVGEPVDLSFLERVKLSSGMVMLYRASRDVHIQHPPEELTVTLNLIVSLPEIRLRDQLFFDLQSKTIADFPSETDSSKRVSLLRLAGYLGDGNSHQLLIDLARKHPCRRTRLAAYEALTQQAPENKQSIWESACDDSAPLVREMARRRLQEAAP